MLRQWTKILLAGLLLAGGIAGWDLYGYARELQQPVEPLPPVLTGFAEPLPAIEKLQLPESLFSAVRPDPAAASSAPVSLPAPAWKLRGILMGSTPKAFLEDPQSGQKLWVTQGQKAGPFTVQEINERSVILTNGEGSVEISL